MTPRQKKRFLKQFHAQVEQERNGAPVPPEIAARMTQPKVEEPLWQVVVEGKLKTGLKPYGPRWERKSAAEMLASEINRCVASGLERTFTKAMVVPLTQLSAGVT